MRLLYVSFFSLFLLVSGQVFSHGPQKARSQNGQFEIFEHSGQYPSISHYGQTRSTQNQIHPLIQFIDQARRSLFIEIYEIKNQDIQLAILKALERGVAIKMVLEPDPIGNGCDGLSGRDPKGKTSSERNLGCLLSAQFMDRFYELASENGTKNKSGIRFFNKNLCFNEDINQPARCVQHGKLMVRDQQDVIISTGNFNFTGICINKHKNKNDCHRDFSVSLQDPQAASVLSKIVELDYKWGVTCDLPPDNPRAEGPRRFTEARCQDVEKDAPALKIRDEIKSLLVDNGLNNLLTVGPVSSQEMIDFIKGAKRDLEIQAQYLRDLEWIDAIKSLLNKGVAVRITLASFCYFTQDESGVGRLRWKDVYDSDGYVKKYLSSLIHHPKNPATLRIFTQGIPNTSGPRNGYLHSKVIIRDKKEAWIGSTNASFMSNHINREFGVFVNNPKTVQKFYNYIRQDFDNSIKLEEHIPDLAQRNSGLRGTCKVSVR